MTPRAAEPDDLTARSNLTPRQVLIWLEDRLYPSVPANNMVMVHRIQGAVDPDRFAQAFAAVVAESDALRSVIVERDGVPFQEVRTRCEPGAVFVDLSGSSDPEAACRAWIDARRVRPLRFEEGVFDSALVRVGPDAHVWYLCQHHIVADAWSFSLIYERVRSRYEGQTTLPALAPFGELAEHRHARAVLGSEAAAFWERKLADPPPPLSFYGRRGDQKRPGTVRLTRPLGKARVQRARTIAGAPNGAFVADLPTLGVFLSAFAAFIHCISEARRFGVAVPMANRPTRPSKRTIGLCMEVVPIELVVEPEDTFASLLARTQKTLGETLPHARHTVRNPATGKLYDVMFNLHNAKFGDFAGAPCEVEVKTGLADPLPADVSGVEAWNLGESLDVLVHDFTGKGAPQVTFDFNPGVFGDQTRARAVDHFFRILDQAFATPDTRVADLDPMGAEERRELLVTRNTTEPLGPPETVLDRIAAAVKRGPGRPALRFGEQTLDYAGLAHRIGLAAGALEAVGVGRGDRVALALPRCLDLPIYMLGVMAVGATYVPLDPDHPPSRLRLALEGAAPRLLVTAGATLADEVREGGKWSVLDLESGPPEAPVIPLSSHRADPRGLAYIIFTSGSTGRPKGVEIQHGALDAFLTAMARRPGLGPDDVLVAVTTVSFDIAGLELYLPLVCGGQVVLVDGATARDPHGLSRTLADRRATVMQATPATWHMLVGSGWRPPPGFRVFCGGEALPRSLADALGAPQTPVWNLYGPTETTIWSTTGRVGPGGGPVSVGCPIDGTRVYVVAPGGRPVPGGVPGELWIAGAGVAAGYHRDPERTAERFVRGVIPEESGPCYRTGDRVRWNEAGELEWIERLDHQVKVRGFRIELGDVAAALEQAPTVDEAVAAVAGEGAERHLIGYVVAKSGGEVDVGAVRAHAQQALPQYMVPSHIVVLESLPRTPNGKTDRSALPPPPAGEGEAEAHDRPRNDLEVRIAAAWRRVLGREVGIFDDFFALGGNSLLAIRLADALERILGFEVPLVELFKSTTVAALAGALGDRGDETVSPVVTLRPGQGGTPLFCLSGIHLYQGLATRLRPDTPVYGVVTAGDRFQVDASAGVPDLAEAAVEHIDAIRRIQPQGPYQLAGVSYGGILAYEMAQQLRAQGETVKLLVLLDAVLPRAFRLRPAQWLAARLRQAVLHPVRTHKTLSERLRRRNLDAPATDDAAQMDAFREARFIRAIEHYEGDIRPYGGDVVLIRAEQGDQYVGKERDPGLGWTDLIRGELRVHDAPGDHVGLLAEPGVQAVAEIVDGYL